jgi:hypothetical protein
LPPSNPHSRSYYPKQCNCIGQAPAAGGTKTCGARQPSSRPRTGRGEKFIAPPGDGCVATPRLGRPAALSASIRSARLLIGRARIRSCRRIWAPARLYRGSTSLSYMIVVLYSADSTSLSKRTTIIYGYVIPTCSGWSHKKTFVARGHHHDAPPAYPTGQQRERTSRRLKYAPSCSFRNPNADDSPTRPTAVAMSASRKAAAAAHAMSRGTSKP